MILGQLKHIRIYAKARTSAMMEYTAVVTARGNSKGIPKKNMQKLCGKPLIYYCINKLIESKCFDNVMVSTDCTEIADYALSLGAEIPYIRPKELAQDDSKSIDVVKDLIRRLDLSGTVCLCQPTSPLLSVEDIRGALNLHISRLLPVATVSESSYRPSIHAQLVDGCSVQFINDNIYDRRQDECRLYKVNGALFIRSAEGIKNTGSFLSTPLLGYVMPKERSVDIDDMLDLRMAELLMDEQTSGSHRG